ncbi:hypothetical protein ACVOZ6_004711 [Escherichia coli]
MRTLTTPEFITLADITREEFESLRTKLNDFPQPLKIKGEDRWNAEQCHIFAEYLRARRITQRLRLISDAYAGVSEYHKALKHVLSVCTVAQKEIIFPRGRDQLNAALDRVIASLPIPVDNLNKCDKHLQQIRRRIEKQNAASKTDARDSMLAEADKLVAARLSNISMMRQELAFFLELKTPDRKEFIRARMSLQETSELQASEEYLSQEKAKFNRMNSQLDNQTPLDREAAMKGKTFLACATSISKDEQSSHAIYSAYMRNLAHHHADWMLQERQRLPLWRRLLEAVNALRNKSSRN